MSWILPCCAGRFDRHIHVELPDIEGREQILAVHAGKVKLSADADLALVARSTPSFSGADLENLINESALHAARHGKQAIDQDDLEYARDRIAFGREKKSGSKGMPEEERRMTAFHEAGHALIQEVLPEVDDFHKVTIIPRGRTLGASFSLPNERRSKSTKELLGYICVCYGGRVAEEMFFDDVSNGAVSDINQATGTARRMVFEFGMSDVMGAVRYTQDRQGFSDTESVIAVSETTQRELDMEVKRILDQQLVRARELLESHRDHVTRIAEALLEHETLSAAQVKILLEGGDIGPRKPTVGPKTGTFDLDNKSRLRKVVQLEEAVEESQLSKNLKR